MDAVRAEADQAMTATKAAEAALSEAQAAADAAVSAAQADADQARAEAAAAQAGADQALADATVAQQDAARARAGESEAMAKVDAMMVDAMMMAAHHPSEVMVGPDMLDISLLNLDQAQASLAGRDSIYISSIRYDGAMFSALLKYEGGTTATVEAIFGESGKLIPDTVGLGLTELAVLAPDKLVVSNIEVGGMGYSGELQYVGGNRLQVAGIRRVALPPTAAEQIAALEAELAAAQAAADAAMAEAEAAMADTATAMADAEAAMADKAASMAEAEAAMAKVDAMMMAAHHPAEVMVSAAMLDPSMANLDHAQVSLAGPDSIYVSNIMYDGVPYSALLKYSGGTSATVEAVYGPMGKLIPDSVGLAQTELAFVSPASLAVSNVEVGDVGYSGTLEYAGGNQLRITGIRRVTLPPTAAEAAAAAIAQAEADAAAAVSGAQAAADAAMAEAEAAMADKAAAMADAEAAMAAMADAADAGAAASQAKVDAMMAEAYQPSEVMVSAAMLDPSMANLDQVQVTLAGPDSIYVSNIMYGGVPFSALLRYRGGTSATVEAVYGPMGKLIPDSVGLAQTALAFVAPASLAVENVEVGGVGYSGTLEYAGGNQLLVTGIRRVNLPPTEAEMAQAENESLKATIADQSDQITALQAALAEAQAAADTAMADADAAMADNAAAMVDADAAMAEAAAAQAKVDAMMAAAYQPSEVMVSAAMLDPSQANIDHAQISLAGPDSIYVSNIMYGGVPYSALLKYSGGTSATVEAVYGPMGKLIPDSVGLSQVELDFVAPASLAIENVEVGGVGYSGTLEYAGGNQLRVTGIRRVTLPPTEAEAAQAAAAAAIAQAEADAAAAIAQAEADAAAAVSEAQAAADMARSEAQAATDAAVSAAMADADAAQAEAAAAQAEVDAMMAAAYQPSEVMVSAAMLDPSQTNIDHAQVSLAGPDSIYVSNIMYGGVPYSALLKYSGGTSATVEAVYGPMGKLLPDSVGLSQVELDFVAPASLAVSNVEVGGVGYSGTLEYAGGNQLRVTGIRRVTLPPTAAEAAAAAIAQAEADAAAAVSDAQAAADAADAEAAQAAADAAMADADAARAEAAAAQAKVDAMMAAAFQPSEVMISAAMLDPSLANIDHAQVSLAGPDSIYISNIMYDGVPYSALLKYSGGTSATVEAVYGPMGKLLPDSVGLSQVELDFVAPASLAIENVEVGGVGYSGTLEYAGGNQLRVTSIRRVTLPPTAAEAAAAAITQAEADAAAAIAQAEADAAAAVSDAQAAADAAMADADAAQAAADAAMADADAARAEAAAAQAKVDAMMAAAFQPSEVMVSAAMLDPSLANIDHAQASLAGPDSIYVSNIMYGGVPYSALLKYSGGTSATVEAVYGPMGKLIPDSVGLSQVELDFVAPASLAIENVEVGGVGYSGTLEYAGGNQLRVTGIRRVTLPPTEAEAAQAAAAAAIAQAEADAAAAIAQAEADAAAAVSEAQAAADAAVSAAMADADAARAAASAAEAKAAAAQAEVDAMMAAAYQPSEVMVSAAMLDPSQANIDHAQVSLAGPDSIYVSNIMYGGVPYSALLKYSGGTSATVEAVYGPMGKLIPDSVGLSQVELDFVAPASLAIENVDVGGVGYSGTLEYAGGNQLQVTGIRRVTLPPTEAEAAQAEAAAAIAQAEADAAAAIAQAEADAAAAVSEAQAAADMARSEAQAATDAAVSAAMADADAARAAASAAEAKAAAAQAEVDAMMAAAYQPSEVMVSAAMLDPSQANIDHAQISLAGPDSIYVSNIMYGGVPYSALLKYSGGTSATVEAVYGPMGKLIPDSVGLSQVELDFVAPASLAIENVEVGGVGYSGTLEYAGGNQLRVTGIRRVTLPPTEAEAAQAEAAAAIAQAEADAAAAIAQAEADAAAAVSEAQAAADMARSEAQAATDAAVSAAMADADAAQAEAAAAQAEVDAMMAAAYQPSEVMVSAAMLDPSQANIDHAQVSLAGPDSIYVSNIMYGGVPYSALLKYSGGTSATVEAVYGPMGKLIPDSVGLSQVELDFVAPASLAIENVDVGGVGYSGTLEYAGGNQLRVTGIRRVTLPPTEAEAAQAAAAAAIAQAEADAAAAVSEAQAAADMARSEAQAATDAAVSAAMADADAAQAEAAAAQAEVDAMMAAAYQPSEVMVSAAMLDPSQTNIDHAQVSLAGPDSIYVSNIMYGGVPYSALLKYSGGTSATVEAVYGPMGKLLPDSVGLSQVELDFVAPASLAVSNVEVGGVGYSGTLEYAGGNQLRVTGIRRVTLPPTAAEAAAAAIAQAEADAAAAVNAAQAVADAAMADADAAQAAADAAMADADAAMADANAATAEAVAAQAEATAAQAEVDAMMAAAYQPSEVMISAAMLDPSLTNIDNAQVSLAGPDSIYISNIMYDGAPYSALLKYSGGTSATVEAVYGPMGKLLPDSVGLSQVELDFVAPASLAIENVEVGGVGYSGTLEYAGGNQLRVTGIRRVTLPPTEAEAAQAAAAAAIAQAEADAAAAIAQAEADAAVAVSDAQAAADAAMADAGAAQAAADKAMAAADAAQAAANAAEAEAAAAQAKVDAMMAAAYQPSEVMISAAMLNPGLASLDQVQISLAGPDAIYVSNIMYDGAPYSALLKYSGGTSATVEAVYGPMGKLLPDSVGLSQVELAFVAPASVVVSNVEVGGVGYAGTLEYAGGNQLRVTGIRQVTLPPTDAELARADADAAMADAAKARDDAAAAMADADTAKAAAMTANAKVGELEARIKELTEGIPLGINPGLLDLESARLTIAGPNSIYISGIKYAGKDVSARVRYAQGTGTAEAVFESSSNLVDVLDMNAAEVELAGDALVMSNVGIRGRAHTLTLTFNDEGGVDVAAQDDGWAVRTVGELRRDKLITEGTYVVNGFAGGQPLANEGAWSESGGSVVQTDSGASHAKFTIPASQSGSEMLFGVTASAGDGSDKVGFGLHLLASDTPVSGNTWNYGRSYLIWATRDPFYDTDATHLQFYESRDNNTLTWLASRSIDQSLSSPLTLEVLYQSNGMVTLLVGGEEQLSLNIGSAISAGDRVALRSLGGPVQFTQVYVAAR